MERTSTVISALRVNDGYKRERRPGTEILSSEPLNIDHPNVARLMFNGDTAHQMKMAKGIYKAHAVILPHRHRLYRDVREPYAVICRSDLDPIFLASLFQASDHGYLQNNIRSLNSAGFINQRLNNLPYKRPRDIVEQHLQRSFINEVKDVKRRLKHRSPLTKKSWAWLGCRYSSTDPEKLVVEHMNDMYYMSVVIRNNTCVLGSTTEYWTDVHRMETSWMSGSTCYDRVQMCSFADRSPLYAFKIPGLASSSPTAVMFFGKNMRVVAAVIGRGLKPPSKISLIEYMLRGDTVVSSYPLAPKEDDDSYLSDDANLLETDEEHLLETDEELEEGAWEETIGMTTNSGSGTVVMVSHGENPSSSQSAIVSAEVETTTVEDEATNSGSLSGEGGSTVEGEASVSVSATPAAVDEDTNTPSKRMKRM